MTSDLVSQKYLERYAEPVSVEAACVIDAVYQSAVVVPVYGEALAAFTRLTETDPGAGRHLLVFVVNAPTDAPPARLEQNSSFLGFARAQGERQKVSECVDWIRLRASDRGLDALLFDATRAPLGLRPKEGVGRARKIGLDSALALYERGKVLSAMAGSTDADVTLPRDYFSQLSALAYQGEGSHQNSSSLPPFSGLLFPYRHVVPEEGPMRHAMLELELSFRYYVLGLHFARSPYAYHTLGSALAVSLPHYARARGVPNRQAGEDFHLLAKLSKLAPLARLTGGAIEIEARLSDRVPFGTGPSLTRALQESRERRRVYHPSAFVWLREVLEVLTNATESGASDLPAFSSALPAWAQARALDFYRGTLPHLSACPSAAHRVRRLRERFDALATLQFIHEAHRNGLCPLELPLAFELSSFLPSGLGLLEQLQYCEQTELSLTELAGLFPT